MKQNEKQVVRMEKMRLKSLPLVSYRLFILSITALFLCSSMFWGCGEESTDSVFEENFSPYPDIVSSRGGGTGTQEKMKEAMSYYSSKDYKAALPLFEELLASDENNVVVNFYAGVSYLGVKQPEKAIGRFEYVVGKQDATFGTHAKWFLALAHVKNNDVETATVLLTELKEGGTSYKTKATRALASLPKIKRTVATKESGEVGNVYAIGLKDVTGVEYTDVGIHDDISLRTGDNNDKLYIRYNGLYTSGSTIKLYNSKGQMVHGEKFRLVEKGHEKVVDLAYLPNGMYNLQVALDNGRIIKQKVKLY